MTSPTAAITRVDFPLDPAPVTVLTVRTWPIDAIGTSVKKSAIAVNLRRNMSAILTIGGTWFKINKKGRSFNSRPLYVLFNKSCKPELEPVAVHELGIHLAMSYGYPLSVHLFYFRRIGVRSIDARRPAHYIARPDHYVIFDNCRE
jgi:hypothetical protein